MCPDSHDGSWHEVKRVFDEVSCLPLEERGTTLARVRSASPAIAAEVEALLAAEAPLHVDPAVASGHYLALPELESIAAGVPQLLSPGTLCHGFLIKGALGLGRSGPLYVAVEPSTGARVTIRHLAPGYRPRSGVVQTRRATLPNQVIATDQGTFVVSPFVDGISLAQSLLTAPSTTGAAMILATNLLEAVAELHDQGAAHGGLRPSSVVVGVDGTATVLDAGVLNPSWWAASVSHSSRASADLEFVAPEVLQGREPTPQSDVFSLGVLLRHLLADTAVVPEVFAWVERATSLEPGNRPQSARVLLTGVLAASSPTVAGDAVPVRRPAKSVFRANRARLYPADTTPGRRWLEGAFWLVAILAIAKLTLGLPAVIERGLEGLSTAHISKTPFQAVLATEMGLLGVALVLLNRGDARTLSFGLVLLVMATPFVDGPLRDLRLDANRLWQAFSTLWMARTEAFLPAAAWVFTRVSLEPAPRWVARCEGAAWGVGLLLIVCNWPPGATSADGHVVPSLSRVDSHSLYWPLVYAVALPSLVALLASSSGSARQRRQRRLFGYALLAGVLPICVLVAYDSFVGLHAPGQDTVGPLADTVAVSGLLTVPMVAAYAAWSGAAVNWRRPPRPWAHRVVRLSSSIAGLVPFGIVATSLYAGRSAPVEQLFTRRDGMPLALWLVLGIALLWHRATLVEAVDRWFDTTSNEGAAASAPEGEGDWLFAFHARVQRQVRPFALDIYVRDRRSSRFGSVSMPPHWLTLEVAQDAAKAARPYSVWHNLRAHDAGVEATVLRDAPASFVFPVWDQGTLVGLVAATAPLREDDLDSRRIAILGAATHELAASWKSIVGRFDSPFDGWSALECIRCRTVHSPSTAACCGGTLLPAPVPKVLASRFVMERRLGAGASGVVYLANERALKRPVAIKTLRRPTGASARSLRREAQLLGSLSHPNLAVVHALETWQGRPLLVTELLEGGTLATQLSSGPLQPEPFARLVEHTCAALDYLHAKGLVHGDIKANNIGVTPDGSYKLLDFGLATSLEEDPLGQARPSSNVTTGQQLDWQRALEVFSSAGGATVSQALELIYGTPRERVASLHVQLGTLIGRASSADPSHDWRER